MSTEMLEFLHKTENHNPLQRLAAEPLLHLSLFNKERLARQEQDSEMAERRAAQASYVAGRIKALGQASVMEQIMVRFLSSAAHNQEHLRKCREQYQHLLRKQNEALGENAPLED